MVLGMELRVRNFLVAEEHWGAFVALCEGRGVDAAEGLRRLVLRELGLDEALAVVPKGRPRVSGGAKPVRAASESSEESLDRVSESSDPAKESSDRVSEPSRSPVARSWGTVDLSRVSRKPLWKGEQVGKGRKKP